METKLYSNTIEWRIIANKLNKKPITYNEEQQLKRWLDASPDHAEYFNRAAKAWKEKPLNAQKSILLILYPNLTVLRNITLLDHTKDISALQHIR
ncbi:hypothetical protein [Duncaniella freteri]|jgi:ferric-dicitrate binding protein FerR (iron transport regulator)|uniref:hypothetical protein n=1 Tax=Duncaniella freteri TaxID=2530391 RepID=UPI00256F05F8|nr:hypothetical protein [Duncaniella freteri]